MGRDLDLVCDPEQFKKDHGGDGDPNKAAAALSAEAFGPKTDIGGKVVNAVNDMRETIGTPLWGYVLTPIQCKSNQGLDLVIDTGKSVVVTANDTRNSVIDKGIDTGKNVVSSGVDTVRHKLGI